MNYTYQIVSFWRTGSTLLNYHLAAYNKTKRSLEVFNEGLNGGIPIAESFDTLLLNKSNNIHISAKIMPVHVIQLGFERELFQYLDGYPILTIDRDPFDTFLSWYYQDITSWKVCHIWPWTVKPSCDIYIPINLDKVYIFIKWWYDHKNFLNRLINRSNDVTVFNYCDVTNENLSMFFDTDFIADSVPMDINYRNMFSNFEEVREIFNYVE